MISDDEDEDGGQARHLLPLAFVHGMQATANWEAMDEDALPTPAVAAQLMAKGAFVCRAVSDDELIAWSLYVPMARARALRPDHRPQDFGGAARNILLVLYYAQVSMRRTVRFGVWPYSLLDTVCICCDRIHTASSQGWYGLDRSMQPLAAPYHSVVYMQNMQLVVYISVASVRAGHWAGGHGAAGRAAAPLGCGEPRTVHDQHA